MIKKCARWQKQLRKFYLRKKNGQKELDDHTCKQCGKIRASEKLFRTCEAGARISGYAAGPYGLYLDQDIYSICKTGECLRRKVKSLTGSSVSESAVDSAGGNILEGVLRLDYMTEYKGKRLNSALTLARKVKEALPREYSTDVTTLVLLGCKYDQLESCYKLAEKGDIEALKSELVRILQLVEVGPVDGIPEVSSTPPVTPGPKRRPLPRPSSIECVKTTSLPKKGVEEESEDDWLYLAPKYELKSTSRQPKVDVRKTTKNGLNIKPKASSQYPQRGELPVTGTGRSPRYVRRPTVTEKRGTLIRRRLPVVAPVPETQAAPALTPPQDGVPTELVTVLLLLVACLIYFLVVRRFMRPVRKPRDSLRDLEAGLPKMDLHPRVD